MRNFLAANLFPGILAVAGILAMVLWWETGSIHGLTVRAPGMDRSSPSEAPEVGGTILVGRVTRGAGLAGKLPGAWPRFRGAGFDAVAADSPRLARQWPAGGPGRIWTVAMGEGHAGAAVLDGRVYVLDYDREGQADALRCLSLADGGEIWRYSYPVEVKRNHGMSRTVPAVSEQYVVGLGPKCHAFCVDAKTGEAYWLRDLVRQDGATVPPWYTGQCPLIAGDRAVLAPGGGALVLAMDCKTGKIVWRSPNPRGWVMTHSSIMPMEFARRRMYVYCGRGGVAGVSAEDGAIVWDTTEWKISIATVPSPVILPEGKIFLCGGYNSGALMLQLRQHGERLVAETLFRLKPKQFGSTQQTPVFFDGHLYGVRDADKQLVCLDLEGNELWASGSAHRFGIGPYMIADGLIYVLDDEGTLTLAEATPKGYRQLDQAKVLEGNDAWGPMAMAAGRLILRDLTTMICIDVREH